MAKPFDATVKEMASLDPAGFLAALAAPPSEASVGLLNVDLSTVSPEADVVFSVGSPNRYLAQLEIQAGADGDKPLDMLTYSVLLTRRYHLPVQTTLVLLCPSANHANYTGSLDYAPEVGRGRITFDYDIVRIWEQSADALLELGPSLAPLSVLGATPAGLPREVALRSVVDRLAIRLERECEPALANKLLTAAYILAGLRLERQQTAKLFARYFAMRESSSYQAILDEGRQEGWRDGVAKGQGDGRLAEARSLLLKMGSLKLGEPTSEQRVSIEDESDIDRLHLLALAIFSAHSWDELLRVD